MGSLQVLTSDHLRKGLTSHYKVSLQRINNGHRVYHVKQFICIYSWRYRPQIYNTYIQPYHSNFIKYTHPMVFGVASKGIRGCFCMCVCVHIFMYIMTYWVLARFHQGHACSLTPLIYIARNNSLFGGPVE